MFGSGSLLCEGLGTVRRDSGDGTLCVVFPAVSICEPHAVSHLDGAGRLGFLLFISC